ncbi:hypothetical protein Q1M63_04055 (plasmid) [Sinorhizobium meliloti]|nr:hypothetical protein Q1M63_04055 [Sinorhizobium meliloti]
MARGTGKSGVEIAQEHVDALIGILGTAQGRAASEIRRRSEQKYHRQGMRL